MIKLIALFALTMTAQAASLSATAGTWSPGGTLTFSNDYGTASSSSDGPVGYSIATAMADYGHLKGYAFVQGTAGAAATVAFTDSIVINGGQGGGDIFWSVNYGACPADLCRLTTTAPTHFTYGTPFDFGMQIDINVGPYYGPAFDFQASRVDLRAGYFEVRGTTPAGMTFQSASGTSYSVMGAGFAGAIPAAVPEPSLAVPVLLLTIGGIIQMKRARKLR